MSERYPGGLITKSPVTPAGPFETGAASGVWTLEQQMQFKQQGIWPLAGNVPNYIEDVFSTWLYTGNNTGQTITNGIDLSTKGGMTLLQCRSNDTGAAWNVYDTSRGVRNYLVSSSTAAQSTAGAGSGLTAFNANGFTLGTSWNTENFSGYTYASWTFRKQPKFFDIVTFTSGAGTQTINHNLGATPGMIIVKCASVVDSWYVWHRSIPNNALALESTQGTSAFTNPEYIFGNGTVVVQPTSTQFTFYAGNSGSNTYVAYIFAHNAGGFGLTGTDNVISCGSYTGNASTNGPTITLGYEPQWLMVKRTDNISNWNMLDNMRGIPTDKIDATLAANSSSSEDNLADYMNLSATGFKLASAGSAFNASGGTYIYVAIRRGPMKVPTDATKVFGLSARSGTGANATVTGGQTDDAVLIKNRGSAVASLFSSRLTSTGYLVPATTAAEVAAGVTILQANPWDVMDGVKVGTTSTITNASGNTFVNYLFKRAPSFMDVVCYTGTGSATNVTHNLGIAPQLIIVKGRNTDGATADSNWAVWSNALTTGYNLFINSDSAEYNGNGAWFGSTPSTSTTFGASVSNVSAKTYVAYLFATCAGVSKVGSYTGNGSTQTIDCGLTAGARFVLLKRTDATGDWYVYDTARGMTTLTDPYWLTNTTAAEVATLGSVTTVATGFALNSTILAAINVNAGTYIFLAIA